MSRLPAGQYYPGNAPLYRVDARAKLACFIVLLIACVCTRSVAGYVFFGAVTAVIVWRSGLPVRVALGAFARLWRFLIVIFVMNVLFFGAKRPLWHWWIFSLSVEGAIQGMRMVLNVSLMIVLSNVLMCTTRPTALTDAFSCMLRPLKYVGVPVEDVAMIIIIAIRFIPTLMEETDMIRLAQTARGARFDSKRLLDKAQSALPLVVPIFISAFKRADDLAQAMEARGYRGAAGRTVRKRQRLHRADYIAMFLSALVCVAQLSILH